jgi:hypothetical protein
MKNPNIEECYSRFDLEDEHIESAELNLKMGDLEEATAQALIQLSDSMATVFELLDAVKDSLLDTAGAMDRPLAMLAGVEALQLRQREDIRFLAAQMLFLMPDHHRERGEQDTGVEHSPSTSREAARQQA